MNAEVTPNSVEPMLAPESESRANLPLWLPGWGRVLGLQLFAWTVVLSTLYCLPFVGLLEKIDEHWLLEAALLILLAGWALSFAFLRTQVVLFGHDAWQRPLSWAGLVGQIAGDALRAVLLVGGMHLVTWGMLAGAENVWKQFSPDYQVRGTPLMEVTQSGDPPRQWLIHGVVATFYVVGYLFLILAWLWPWDAFDDLEAAKTTGPQRPWWQFSLLALLGAMTITAVVCSIALYWWQLSALAVVIVAILMSATHVLVLRREAEGEPPSSGLLLRTFLVTMFKLGITGTATFLVGFLAGYVGDYMGRVAYQWHGLLQDSGPSFLAADLSAAFGSFFVSWLAGVSTAAIVGTMLFNWPSRKPELLDMSATKQPPEPEPSAGALPEAA